jgi:hypothetical protein
MAIVGERRSTATSTTAAVRTAPRRTNEVAAGSKRGDGREGTTTAIIIVGATTALPTREMRVVERNSIVVGTNTPPTGRKMRSTAKDAIVLGTTLTLTRKKTRGMAKNAIAIVGMMTSTIVDNLGRGDQSVYLSRSTGLWLTGGGAPARRVLVAPRYP